LIFFEKKQNKIFENYKKLQKNRKKSKNKNVLFYLIVSVWSPAPYDTYFLKNTENSFLPLLVFVRPLASCDTYFQVIQNTKKYEISKNIKISTFSNNYFFFKELSNPDFSF